MQIHYVLVSSHLAHESCRETAESERKRKLILKKIKLKCSSQVEKTPGVKGKAEGKAL